MDVVGRANNYTEGYIEESVVLIVDIFHANRRHLSC